MSGILASRRGFLTGLGAVLITAPAIVRAGSLMPVKVLEFDPARMLDAWLDHAHKMANPPLYGLSPAMQALQYLGAHDRLISRIINSTEYLAVR